MKSKLQTGQFGMWSKKEQISPKIHYFGIGLHTLPLKVCVHSKTAKNIIYCCTGWSIGVSEVSGSVFFVNNHLTSRSGWKVKDKRVQLPITTSGAPRYLLWPLFQSARLRFTKLILKKIPTNFLITCIWYPICKPPSWSWFSLFFFTNY